MSGPDRSPLELVLLRARAGEVPVTDLIAELMRGEIVVPSGAEVGADGSGFRPVLYDKDGTPMVGSFSDLALAASVSSLAPYALKLRGTELLRRMPPGHGLVVNPGHDAWFDLSPEGVARALAEFG